MKISFHGAASCVTGSCHLLEMDGFRLLVDCGLFQGADELFGGESDPFGFDPREIDAVLLTHAHLDHCGRLPLLFRQGFRGPIYSTQPTRLLSGIVLQDAAHLHEEARDRRHNHAKGIIHKRDDASYNISDVIETMALFQTVALKTPVKLHPDVTATFHDAGHILGSASIQVSVREKVHCESVRRPPSLTGPSANPEKRKSPAGLFLPGKTVRTPTEVPEPFPMQMSES